LGVSVYALYSLMRREFEMGSLKISASFQPLPAGGCRDSSQLLLVAACGLEI
jgi:hypothetical protein